MDVDSFDGSMFKLEHEGDDLWQSICRKQYGSHF